MVTIILLAIALALANGSRDIEQLKNDFSTINHANGHVGNHRLSGWIMNGPNNKKCDIVRRNITRFGYCWQDENAKRGIDTTKERGWVREVVNQWAKCGNIAIVEEPTCRFAPDFVTVKVGNFAPVTVPTVNEKTCEIFGFTINMDFYTYGVSIDSYRETEKLRKSNIQMYALHEFGHFLGFDHEQNRDDRAPCYWQVDESVGPNKENSNYYLTQKYDIDSIMNYCRPNVHYKPWLSNMDKQAVADTYGKGRINWDECNAVTKPWVWVEGEGADVVTVKELNGTTPSKIYGGGLANDKGCFDRMTQDECNNLKGSCKDEGMKYWCPVTCNVPCQ